MKRIALTAALALLAPTVAAAAPVVWWHVPDKPVDVLGSEASLMDEERMVTDHEVALERREMAEELAHDFLADARDDKKMVRKARRNGKKMVRKARRGNGDLMLATSTLADLDRDFMEVEDLIDLQKARIDARKEHVELEKSRYKRAVASLELAEAELLRDRDGKGTWWHNPERYEDQLQRITERTQRERSEWDLARVDVRERAQDHYNPADYVAWQTTILPAPPMTTSTAVGSIDTDDTLYDLRRVHFDLGSSMLDTEALNNLAWNAHVLRDNRDVTVRVEGHTDATGTAKFNRALAWDRAEAIEAYLMDNGVWDAQMETVAYGELVPAVATDEATPLNRRAEFVILDDADGLVDGTLDNDLMVDDWN